MKIDLSNSIASEMDRVLNSDENKSMFSSAKMLEKLAFKRVSEADEPTALETEVTEVLDKTASKKECECECHEDKDAKTCECCEEKKATASLQVVAQDEYSLALNAAEKMLSISETLDGVGFEKLATVSLMLANKIVVEAKAKAKKKSTKTDEKKSEKDKAKKDSKKSSDKKSSDKKSPKKDMKDSKKSSDKKSK